MFFSFKKGRKTPTCYATLYCSMLHTPACIPVKIKTCTLYYMYHKTNIVFIKAEKIKFNIHASFIFPMNIKNIVHYIKVWNINMNVNLFSHHKV